MTGKMKAKKNSKSVYILKIMSIYALSAVILAVGSVNCHNRVSSSKMVLFDVEKEGDELVITVMDREYRL